MIGVAVLGSTGSIGRSTLDVLARHPDRFRVVGLAANRNLERLVEQCVEFRPAYASLADVDRSAELQVALGKAGLATRVLAGPSGIEQMASLPEAPYVMAAIVGAAGLRSTLAAAASGKRLLVANKESIIMSGRLVLEAAERSGARLIPIDSEHNAIFQCLPAGGVLGSAPMGVRRILLTASGGPFRDWSAAALQDATPDQACAHPNWTMGRKISVDSATLMNKGLELIEAGLLFGLPPDRIEVVIHRQSVVHSLVEYVDGSVLAQLGSPDMRTPIAQALAWPQRLDAGVQFLDLLQVARLDFEPPDFGRFPCLGLALDAARAGGEMPAVLNAANEVAVQAFLDGRLNFGGIARVIGEVMNSWNGAGGDGRLEAVLEADARARSRASDVVRRGAAERGQPTLNLSWQHLLAFIVAVGVLVTVHEFGHYWVARLLGFKVLRFSVGFGKALWSRVAGQDRTEYVIAAIPLGGYVKLLDEREAPVDPAEQHRAFNRRPHWQRILVLLAGPAFNIAFAIILLAGMFWANGVTELRAVVGEVQQESPAGRAGLRGGDEIVSLAGHPVAGQSDVVLGLLESMTDDGIVRLGVLEESGARREVQLQVADPAERRRMTEPDHLMTGIGFEFWQPVVPAKVGMVEAGGPAATAGVVVGDEVLAVDDVPVTGFADLRRRIESAPGQTITLDIRRSGRELSVPVAVAAADVSGRRVGRLGIGSGSVGAYPAAMLRHTNLGAGAALARGSVEAWKMTVLQAQVFWRMVLGKVSLKNLSGPLTIAEYAGDSARSGPSAFVGFLVLISLSLGFLNLLPIPILDGGQIVYQLLEWVKGAPLSERFMAFGQQLGIGLLVLMMGVALFNDIVRQFG